MIPIIWGKTTRRRELGWVCEYCATCRAPRPMRLRSARQYSHICFIAVSYIATTGHELRCGCCRRKQPTDPTRYASLSPASEHDIAQLCEETNPFLTAAIGLELDHEEMLECVEMTDPDPAGKLVRMFMTTRLQLLERGMKFDWPTAAAFLVAAAPLVAGLGLLGAGLETAALIVFGVFGLCAAVGVFIAAREPGRFVRRVVEPSIARHASGLGVRREDWEVALDRLQMLDVELKGWLPRERICALLDRVTEEESGKELSPPQAA